MAVKIISGYPCRNCGCWSVGKKTDCTYFWVDFVVLVEKITNYFLQKLSAHPYSGDEPQGRNRHLKESKKKDKLYHLSLFVL